MAFIVFEGLDGSGKSSLVKALETELSHRRIIYQKTREPGGTELGEELRNIILRRGGAIPSPRTELLLYEACRSQHVDEIIRPNLKRKIWVLCDRFSASSLAFQAGGRLISEEHVVWLNHFATNGLKPDLTVLLDLSVQESKARRLGRTLKTGELDDRIESEADHFHERVRQSFLKQAESDSDAWLVMDARLPEEKLNQILIETLIQKKLL